MRAIRQHVFGGPEVLRCEEVNEPQPGGGQVGIAVEAAGVHVVDTTIRRGQPFGPAGVAELPMTPGREVAGRVVDGEAAWIGRRVAVHLGFANGGYAERAVAGVASLHEVPDGVDAAEAVAMIGTGRTAMLILDLAEVQPGDVVLVTSAAGGLGNLFVQAIGNAGATAVGLAGGSKLDLVAGLGAVPVDDTDPGWPKLVERTPTLVLDGVGGEIGRAAVELLRSGGRVVTFGWSSGRPTPLDGLEERGITIRSLYRPDDLRPFESASMEALATGALRPLVTRFPLAEAATAHTDLENRRTTGKVVLIP
jgi:NADPH2:quinone reductase